MRQSMIVGAVAGFALGGWNLLTMLWPVAYITWDLGRSTLFVAFAIALTALAASAVRSRAPAARTAGSVAVAYIVAAIVTLTTYAIATRLFTNRIVQLPEYLRDYTYHGYRSPASYLSANYSDLLQLQVFSWAIGGVALIVVAGASGWGLGILWLRARAA